MHRLMAAAMLLSLAGCASAPEPVDRVDAARSRIALERDAGQEARQVCASLGMADDGDCKREIAGARLGLDSGAALGKFVR